MKNSQDLQNLKIDEKDLQEAFDIFFEAQKNPSRLIIENAKNHSNKIREWEGEFRSSRTFKEIDGANKDVHYDQNSLDKLDKIKAGKTKDGNTKQRVQILLQAKKLNRLDRHKAELLDEIKNRVQKKLYDPIFQIININEDKIDSFALITHNEGVQNIEKMQKKLADQAYAKEIIDNFMAQEFEKVIKDKIAKLSKENKEKVGWLEGIAKFFKDLFAPKVFKKEYNPLMMSEYIKNLNKDEILSARDSFLARAKDASELCEEFNKIKLNKYQKIILNSPNQEIVRQKDLEKNINYFTLDEKVNEMTQGISTRYDEVNKEKELESKDKVNEMTQGISTRYDEVNKERSKAKSQEEVANAASPTNSQEEVDHIRISKSDFDTKVNQKQIEEIKNALIELRTKTSESRYIEDEKAKKHYIELLKETNIDDTILKIKPILDQKVKELKELNVVEKYQDGVFFHIESVIDDIALNMSKKEEKVRSDKYLESLKEKELKAKYDTEKSLTKAGTTTHVKKKGQKDASHLLSLNMDDGKKPFAERVGNKKIAKDEHKDKKTASKYRGF